MIVYIYQDSHAFDEPHQYSKHDFTVHLIATRNVFFLMNLFRFPVNSHWFFFHNSYFKGLLSLRFYITHHFSNQLPRSIYILFSENGRTFFFLSEHISRAQHKVTQGRIKFAIIFYSHCQFRGDCHLRLPACLYDERKGKELLFSRRRNWYRSLWLTIVISFVFMF